MPLVKAIVSVIAGQPVPSRQPIGRDPGAQHRLGRGEAFGDRE